MESNKKTFWLLPAAVIIVVVSVVVAVRNMAPSSTTKPYSGVVTQYIQYTINDCNLTVDSYANDQTYDTITLNSQVGNTFTVGEFSGYQIYINNQEIPSGGTIQVTLERLSKETPIEIRYVDLATGAERKQYIRTLPSAYMEAQVVSNDPEEGYYYFNVDEYVYKMSTTGNIVFWRAAGGEGLSMGGCDFKRTEVEGSVYYSFLWGGDSTQYPALPGVGYGRMQACVLDENYNVVGVVPFLLPYKEVKENCRMENHQFSILGKDHYLLSAYVGKQVTNIPDEVPHSPFGSRVVATVLQEIKDGQVVFQWNSTDYPELYGISQDSNDYFNAKNLWSDYAHFNAAVVDPKDNNLICSFRNLDTILKIDRATGEILWKLGGAGDEFGLTVAQKFARQHDVKVTEDGAITLFNNGNLNGSDVQGQTSIMKFYLDENSKKVLNWKEHTYSDAFSPFMGSAQELGPDHFIVGWGYRNTTLPLFSEIDFSTNTVLFEYVRPNSNLSGISPHSYRVYKSAN